MERFTKTTVQKNVTHLKKNEQFILILNDLFDIAQANAHNITKIEKDRAFLISHIQKYQPGSLNGIHLKMF